MIKKNSHCTYCGHRFDEPQLWPRTCTACGNTSFLNPVPVSVVLVPIDDGVLVVRRNIEPQKGQLALPGGYINYGESWQAAGAREVFEETGLMIDPDHIREFRVRSAPDSTLLIFGLAKPIGRAITRGDLPPFVSNEETQEIKVITAPEELAFSLHTEVLRDYFDQLTKGGIA
jgi:ADP-ribose pyrophosphatase YjhB (NUDIX family)